MSDRFTVHTSCSPGYWNVVIVSVSHYGKTILWVFFFVFLLFLFTRKSVNKDVRSVGMVLAFGMPNFSNHLKFLFHSLKTESRLKEYLTRILYEV